MDDADVDRLYSLPLDAFVAERNKLAKERKDPALRKLRKPSVAAGAVNQLARSHAELMRRLVDAASDVRAAQQRAVSGARSGGSDLRSATGEHRSAVDALVDSLPASSTSVADRVRATLSAASLDGELVPDLVAGRLVDDVEPAGFGDLSSLELLTFDEEPEEEPEDDPKVREARAAMERELEEARDALRDARQREADARAALDRAYDAVRDAERRVDELAAQLEDG